MQTSYTKNQKTILIVDDNGINRLVPGLILRPFGWCVYEADGGASALEALEKTPDIDCVLLDISMPEISGYKVLQELRKKYQKNLKVIAYTAYAEEKDIAQFLGLGFDAVLIKPLTSIKLLDILRSK